MSSLGSISSELNRSCPVEVRNPCLYDCWTLAEPRLDLYRASPWMRLRSSFVRLATDFYFSFIFGIDFSLLYVVSRPGRPVYRWWFSLCQSFLCESHFIALSLIALRVKWVNKYTKAWINIATIQDWNSASLPHVREDLSVVVLTVYKYITSLLKGEEIHGMLSLWFVSEQWINKTSLSLGHPENNKQNTGALLHHSRTTITQGWQARSKTCERAWIDHSHHDSQLVQSP